jgi:hypothetical protein
MLFFKEKLNFHHVDCALLGWNITCTSMLHKLRGKNCYFPQYSVSSNKKLVKFVVQKVTVLVWLLAALLGIPTLIAKVGK